MTVARGRGAFSPNPPAEFVASTSPPSPSRARAARPLSEEGSTGRCCGCCLSGFVLFFFFLPFFVAWWLDAADDDADDDPFDAGREPLSRSALTAAAVTSADADAWAAERGNQGPAEAWEAQEETPAALVVDGSVGRLARELAKTKIITRNATEAPPATAPVTKDDRCLCLAAWAGDRGGGLDFEGL